MALAGVRQGGVGANCSPMRGFEGVDDERHGAGRYLREM